MIKFACTCGEPFEVPQSEAGDSFQCPVCHRLVDVPLLSDLAALDEDGTLKLIEPEANAPELGEKMNAFSFRNDMRMELGDFMNIGVDHNDGPKQRQAPRYDPETGELVTVIDVRPDAVLDKPFSQSPANKVLGYAPNRATPAAAGSLTWWRVPVRLFGGMSMMAMFFVFITHVFIHGAFLIPAMNILAILPAFIIVILTVAHYCNTIEDFGPHEMDDVPIYLRNLSVSDDITTPFYNFVIAAVFSFLPTILIFALARETLIARPWIFAALVATSGLMFPAVLLTAICSGALQNLMPPHVFSVILVAPAQYVMATAAFWVAGLAYASALRFTHFSSVAILQITGAPTGLLPYLADAGISYASFMVGIYLMHLAAAWLGMIYRTHRLEFNWMLQRHNSVDRNDTLAQLMRLRQQQAVEQRTVTAARPKPVRAVAATPKPLRSTPPSRPDDGDSIPMAKPAPPRP